MPSQSRHVLSLSNRDEAMKFIRDVVDLATDFKLQSEVRKRTSSTDELNLAIVKDLNFDGQELHEILDEFARDILPDCTNFASTSFMGFPDSGNSIAGLGASVLADFLQQNLINQSICAPSATFVEIAVIRWLRSVIGYENAPTQSIWDTGGIVTPGGTSSNTIAMMLAREHKDSSTMSVGVKDPSKYKIVVPKGIGHYSIKSAQRWLGCGDNLIEVETNDFRYDLRALEDALVANSDSIMALVAYGGDSRTMTVDNFTEVAKLVRHTAPGIWLHADACHGFSLGFSDTLRTKIDGIENFDSVSVDPHKVMLVPYTLSALLIRDPNKLKSITSVSDLIMQEEFAFGQITPFVGSKSWLSLKLWFMMKNFGSRGLGTMVDERHETAKVFHGLISQHPRLKPINDVEINSVAFMYIGRDSVDLDRINYLTKEIYARVVSEGRYHLHQFSVPDRGVFEKDKIIHPLRFMSGNPLLEESDMFGLIDYIDEIGQEVEMFPNE